MVIIGIFLYVLNNVFLVIDMKASDGEISERNVGTGMKYISKAEWSSDLDLDLGKKSDFALEVNKDEGNGYIGIFFICFLIFIMCIFFW